MTRTPLRFRPEVEAVLGVLDTDEWKSLDEVCCAASEAFDQRLTAGWTLTCLETALVLGIAARSAEGLWSAADRTTDVNGAPPRI